MKILVSHFGLFKKSGWGRTFEEAKGLSSLGHQVTLLCSICGKGLFYKRFEMDGVRIYAFFDLIPRRFLASGFGIVSLFARLVFAVFHDFDICLSNSHRDNAYYPCALNRFVYHSKLVIEWWDNFIVKNERIQSPGRLTRFRIRGDLRREVRTKLASDAVVALSSTTALRAKQMGVRPDKITVIRGGCDVDHIRYFHHNEDLKSVFGFSNQTMIFGYIGDGDSELPDMGVFFEALAELAEKYHIKFLNFGGHFNKAISISPELSNVVENCGWVDYYEDSELLSVVDVFVLIKQDNLENQSGWPNKLGDYLSCGRPVLLNPYGEIIHFINEWEPGFIEVENSKGSIIDAISSICGGKYDLIRMGKKNRQIAYENSWANKAKELEFVFDGLIQK